MLFMALIQVKTKLKGHHKRITGLAFSNALNVLVSSGADSQVKKVSKRQCTIRNLDILWKIQMIIILYSLVLLIFF